MQMQARRSNTTSSDKYYRGVAAYETLQRVMPKEEALQTVHGYVEELARTSHKQLAALLHIPGLYRLVPGVFVKSTRSVFGPAAGFDSKELQVGNGIWGVDIATTLLPETRITEKLVSVNS